MSPIDSAAYAASEFDRLKLDRYALRVATETKRPLQTSWSASERSELGPHWVIFEYSWLHRHNSMGSGRPPVETDEITRRFTLFALAPTGKIIRAHIENVEIENTIGRGMQFWKFPGTEDLREATDKDVLELDYSFKEESWGRGKNFQRGTRPGAKLVHHAKGVGMSMALRRLLKS